MADNIELQIGDQVFRVPRWATEETASKMAGYNEASAKALTELLKVSAKGNKVVMENQKIFRDLKTATKRDQTEFIKSQEKLVDVQNKHGDMLKKTGEKVKKAGDNLLSAFNKDSLSGIVAALIPIGALGTAAGFAVATLESFSKNVANLTNVGVGLGVTLVDLRQQAAATGLNIEDYGKLVMNNGDALRALGDNAQDGARQFSAISQQTRIMAREFNNFGLTNQEFNDYLLAEIEIRRKAGFEQERLTQGLSQSFNELMVETTAMAAITGQDRREMLRRRQELLSDPSLQASQLAAAARGDTNLANNLGAISNAFGAGGEVGNQIGMAIAKAITQGRDFRAISGGALAPVAALNSEVGGALTSLQEFIRDNINTMDTKELEIQMASRLAAIGDLLSPEDFEQLAILADTGSDGAADLVTFLSELQGLEADPQVVRDTVEQTEQQLRDAGVIGLPATIQEMTNALKSSALTTVIDQLGLDVESSGSELVEALRGITDNFGIDQGVFEGMKNSYNELTDASDKLKHALVGAAVAAGALSLTFGGRKMLGGLFRGLGGLGSKATGAVRGGVSKAAAAAPAAGSMLSKSNLAKLGRKIPYLGAIIGGGLGVVDQEYQGAGHGFLDRAALGIGEGIADVGDLGWNLITGAGGLLGMGPGWDNDVDLSKSFKDWSNSPEGMRFYYGRNDPRVRAMSQNSIPAFDPSVATADHRISENLTGIVQGATHGSRPGEVNVGMDASNAHRFLNSDNEHLKAMAEAILEQNRLMRRQLDVLENQ